MKGNFFLLLIHSLTKCREMTSNQYWVDDLPLCKLAAFGMMSNQQNDTDNPSEIHEYEDRKFHFT